mmetsp:Transcript_28467/g.60371  ORF Transcript_28467/g.60371 Transcript_28467/m.60371 type:complete len:203 (+) Transcript_28467:114-722(+)
MILGSVVHLCLSTLYTSAQCCVRRLLGRCCWIRSKSAVSVCISSRNELRISKMTYSPPMTESVRLVSAMRPMVSTREAGSWAFTASSSSKHSLGSGALYFGSIASMGSLLMSCLSSFAKASTWQRCTSCRAVADGKLSGPSERTERKYSASSISPACSLLRPLADFRIKEIDMCTFCKHRLATDTEVSSAFMRSMVSGISSR